MRRIYRFFALDFILAFILLNAGCVGPDFGREGPLDTNDVFGVMAFADYDENYRLFFRTDEDLILIPNESMEDAGLVEYSNRYFLDYEPISEITDNRQCISIWGIHEVDVRLISAMPDHVEDISQTHPDFTIKQIWRTSKYVNVKYMFEQDDNVRLSMFYDDSNVLDSTVTELDLYLVSGYEEQKTNLSSNIHLVSFDIEILKQRFPRVNKYAIKGSMGNILFTFVM